MTLGKATAEPAEVVGSRAEAVVKRPRLSAMLAGACLVAGGLVVTSVPANASQTYNETTGGQTHSWSNYTNAGGTAGPVYSGSTTLPIDCVERDGFAVQDANRNWYRISGTGFFASADAFYNNGAMSGSLHGTPYVDPAVPTCESMPTAPLGVNETAGGVAHTWTNPSNAGGAQGPSIAARQTVLITCKLSGFRVADGNTWWYQIGSAPWTNQYFVSADAFYNNGATSGSLTGTPFADGAVPTCGGGSGSTGGTGGGTKGGTGGGGGLSETAISIFFSGTNDPHGGYGRAVAKVDVPLSSYANCSTSYVARLSQPFDTLSGWSRGRTQVLTYLKLHHAAALKDVHYIVLIDPGKENEISAGCDVHSGFDTNTLLADWLSSNSHNELLIFSAVRTEDRRLLGVSSGTYGSSTFTGIKKYYLAGIKKHSAAVRARAFVCDYNNVTHEKIMKDAAGWVGLEPGGCPRLVGDPSPVLWHP